MNPRSGRCAARSAFCFLASRASAAESVLALTVTSPDVSVVMTESLHGRRSNTDRVSHPARRSFAPAAAAGFAGTHLPTAAALATHSVSPLAAGRRDTEYMSAASDDTATARS